MTDANHEEGPAPEDTNFPKTLRITIGSGDEMFEDAIAAAGAGDRQDAVVSVETAEGLRRLLTDRRLELLRSLMVEPAPSITALADRLDRSYSVVHDDVEVLGEYGIVQFRREGQSKQPFVPYERIEFGVVIEKSGTDDDTEVPA